MDQTKYKLIVSPNPFMKRYICPSCDKIAEFQAQLRALQEKYEEQGKGLAEGHLATVNEDTQGSFRAITDDTVKAIKEAVKATGLALEVPYSKAGISVNIPLNELTEADGQGILEWFKAQ